MSRTMPSPPLAFAASISAALVALVLGMLGCSAAPRSAARAHEPMAPPLTALATAAPVASGVEQGCWVPELGPITSRGERFSLLPSAAFVSVVPRASVAVRQAARALSEQLARITGESIAVREVERSEAHRGIVIGTAAELPELARHFEPREPRDEEAYWIRSEPSRLLLVAATDRGVMHGVWDFLHQLGYRRYFPGSVWQITPRLPRLTVQTDRVCRPAFHQRNIWYGFGDWPDNADDLGTWSLENRLGGIQIETGHSYARIVQRHAAEFAAHPEYLARGDAGASAKFCVSEPGLVALVERYAARQLELEPERASISLEPSDGGGWQGCPGDEALGTPSNRAVVLANAVAEHINLDPARPRFVGMYAYHEHALAPTLPVHPRVVVFAANAYLPIGLDVFDVIRDWRAAGRGAGGTLMGVREYYSVNAWDRDRPGVARASSPRALAEGARDYYAAGARFFSAEAGDGWGPHGLGYWVAAASLWTADDPATTESYVSDFLHRAFGKAASTMAAFYARIDRDSAPLFGPELIGELYRNIARAREIEPSRAVGLRLQALAHYLRYLDLWLAYDVAEAPDRQEHFERLMRYTYAIRRDHMVHSFGLRRDLSARDRRVVVPSGLRWREPGGDPWRDGAEPTTAMVEEWIREGLTRPRLPSVAWPEREAPLQRQHGQKSGMPATTTLLVRGAQRLHMVLEAPSMLELEVRAGVVRAVAPIRLRLCAGRGRGAACETRLVPADRASHTISFSISERGEHTLELEDYRQGTYLSWPAGTPVALHATAGERPALWSRWSLYLFVPHGTRELSLFSSGGAGSLLDPHGYVAHEFSRRPGLVRVVVPPGLDGQCWKFHSNLGHRLPLNVPPWLVASPNARVAPEPVF